MVPAIANTWLTLHNTNSTDITRKYTFYMSLYCNQKTNLCSLNVHYNFKSYDEHNNYIITFCVKQPHDKCTSTPVQYIHLWTTNITQWNLIIYAYEILVCSALDTELHLNHGNFKLLSFLRAILLLWCELFYSHFLVLDEACFYLAL